MKYLYLQSLVRTLIFKVKHGKNCGATFLTYPEFKTMLAKHRQ
jgi:hypothetical protein